MTAQHTPGRLEANDKRSKGGGGFSLFEGGQYIGFVSDSDAITDWEANARRLVACWNACEGIEDPENVIPQLRRANDLVQQLEPLRIVMTILALGAIMALGFLLGRVTA
jgi:hypothetical protein